MSIYYSPSCSVWKRSPLEELREEEFLEDRYLEENSKDRYVQNWEDYFKSLFSDDEAWVSDDEACLSNGDSFLSPEKRSEAPAHAPLQKTRECIPSSLETLESDHDSLRNIKRIKCFPMQGQAFNVMQQVCNPCNSETLKTHKIRKVSGKSKDAV